MSHSKLYSLTRLFLPKIFFLTFFCVPLPDILTWKSTPGRRNKRQRMLPLRSELWPILVSSIVVLPMHQIMSSEMKIKLNCLLFFLLSFSLTVANTVQPNYPHIRWEISKENYFIFEDMRLIYVLLSFCGCTLECMPTCDNNIYS